MNILVLGASSNIGYNITTIFCKNNCMILVGRDRKVLVDLQDQCLTRHAKRIIIFSSDLYVNHNLLLEQIKDIKIDLIINALSSTSRLRDYQLTFDRINYYLHIDILVPLKIMEECIRNNPGVRAKIIFISSILSLVPSKDRKFYSASKRIFEIALERSYVESRNINFQIIFLGKVFETKSQRSSRRLANFANFILRNHQKGNKIAIYGFEGKILFATYLLSPLLLFLLQKVQRYLRPENNV